MSSQKEIIEIECNSLISNFKEPKTIALVKENIRHIPDGSLSHCAGALNLVFEKAFELKKKKRQSPGAKLWCLHGGCVLKNGPVFLSHVGPKFPPCPGCRNTLYKRVN